MDINCHLFSQVKTGCQGTGRTTLLWIYRHNNADFKMIAISFLHVMAIKSIVIVYGKK